MDLDAGVALDGRYRLTERLGSGGSALVWRAEDEVLDRPVAVKVLSTPQGDHDFRERFRREARAAARLTHGHIAGVFDYGEADVGRAAPVPFIVMELLEGQTVAERLEQGRLHWREAAGYCAQLADALKAAHAAGVLHRDVKPGNIFLTATGVKVLDFGIATTTWDPALTLTGGGIVLGTPAYVAPERLSGQPATTAADVYSLGIVLFEMIAGWPPFLADDWEALAAAHRHEQPPALTWVPGLPHQLDVLIRDCMAKRPEERPASAEVEERLRSLLGSLPAETENEGAGQVLGFGAVSGDPVGDRGWAFVRAGEAGSSSRRVPLALLVAAAVLVVLALAGYLAQSSPPAGNSAATSLPSVRNPATTVAPGPAVAQDGSAADGAAPGDGATTGETPSGATTGPSTRTATPSATPPATPPKGDGTVRHQAGASPQDAILLIRRDLDQGVADQQIRPDVATDLGHFVDDLQVHLEAGASTGDAVARVADLERKVDARVRENAVSDATAADLQNHLDALRTALTSTV